jgi:hypothetical protein
MEHFYDGQIRRYVGQVIRMLSGFKYKAADGKLTTIPVAYGDMTRQVASIIRDNSENKLPSAPRIAVYITGVALDRNRLSDATHVSKVHIRERAISEDGTEYLNSQGLNYTVERIMPTPYKLTVKADIWSTNTDQKLQILEQIMMLFNPSLEIQTTDNYVDWTSLSVVEMIDIVFSSRSIPVGIDSDIDVATLTFETPIWISMPSKVKKLGIITDVIMNIFDESTGDIDSDFIVNNPTTQEKINISNFGILVWNNEVSVLEMTTAIIDNDLDSDEAISKYGPDVNWNKILDQYPGKFRAGLSQLILTQASGNTVVGVLSLNPTDETKLSVNWDTDTFPTNTLISSTMYPVGKGTIDAIIDPKKFNPGTPAAGTRYLILDDIGDEATIDGPDAWKNSDNTDFIAKANDIIEWNGAGWEIVLESASIETVVYVTNLKTGIQYKYLDREWTKSFEGEYPRGSWRLVL